METIKITVKDKKHAQMLTELAKELNFVSSVESLGDAALSSIPKATFSCPEDFLSMCGIWKDRDISADEIREKAWRKIKL